MKKKRKFLVAILILAVIIGGILLGRFIYRNTSIKEIVQNKKDAASKNDIVATIEGNNLTESECRVYLVALSARIEGIYGSEIWDYRVNEEGQNYRQMLKDQMLEKLIYIKLVCSHADDYGVKFDSEDQVEVNGYVNDFFESISEATADKYGLSKDLVTGIYRDNVLASKVYNKITLSYEVETTEEDLRQGDFEYIVIHKTYTDEEGNVRNYSGESLEALKTKVDEAYAVASSGDMKAAAGTFSDEDTYTVTCGRADLPEEIADSVMALTDGQVSPILETDDSYYIYRCVSAKNESATGSAYQLAVAAEREKYFANLYTEWYNKANIEIETEKWDEVEF